MLQLVLGLGLPPGWVGVPREPLPRAAPLRAAVRWSLCFIPGCRVSGVEKGGQAAGDGVDHMLSPAQA